MGSPLKFTVFLICFVVAVAVAAAQYGSGSDYDNANAPSASPRSLSYPAAIIVLLPFILTFLAAKESV